MAPRRKKYRNSFTRPARFSRRFLRSYFDGAIKAPTSEIKSNLALNLLGNDTFFNEMKSRIQDINQTYKEHPYFDYLNPSAVINDYRYDDSKIDILKDAATKIKQGIESFKNGDLPESKKGARDIIYALTDLLVEGVPLKVVNRLGVYGGISYWVNQLSKIQHQEEAQREIRNDIIKHLRV